MRIAIVCLLLACSKTKQAPSATFDKLKVSVDGKPFAVDRAFIKHPSPDVYTVMLGAGKGACDVDAGVAFTVAKRVAPTGHDSFVVTDVWSRDFDVTPPAPTKIKLDGMKLELPAITAGKLTMSGELTATDCPAAPPTGIGVPKTTHPSKGTITVAGKPLAIAGVTVKTRAGVAATDLPNITISTNAKDCSAVTLPAPVILERIDTKWSMRGTWFAEPVVASDAPGLVFTANAAGTSVDGPTIELQFSGSGKLGDYSIKLDGTAEAIECVR